LHKAVAHTTDGKTSCKLHKDFFYTFLHEGPTKATEHQPTITIC